MHDEHVPTLSVVMPVYGVERFVGAAIESVLAQTHRDFELVVVDDRSPDGSLAICRAYDDPRIRIVSHRENRGLAGARNTGIRHARAPLVAFLDSDDLWEPTKLERHVEHLAARPEVGLSFSRSAFVDEAGRRLNTFQMPKLTGIDADHLLCRNPVGNGSAPVIRRETLDDIRVRLDRYGEEEDFWFDDALRQSEDIECWIRIAVSTDWRIEGLSEPLTLYRLNAGGLSANIPAQLATWETMMANLAERAPALVARSGKLARAFQLRYLARQAVRLHDGPMALRLAARALATDARVLTREPGRTLTTFAAGLVQTLLPERLAARLQPIGLGVIGTTQRLRMALR